MSDKPIPRQLDPHNGFDLHRNSSRVFPVEKGAAADAVKTIRAYVKRHPKHAKWLLEKHPTMTEDEHWDRFAVVYKKGELS